MARRRRPPRAGAISELPPLKIASQIVALQALYYAAAFGLVLFSSLVSGTPFSLDLVFSWQSVRGDTTAGWLAGFLWVVDGGLFMYVTRASHLSPLIPRRRDIDGGVFFFSFRWEHQNVWLIKRAGNRSIAIVLLVARSKLVLDFALSLHAIHLLVVTLYTRQLPRNPAWWLAMAASSGASVALGVWGCRYRELRPITFGGGANTGKGQNGAAGGDNGEGGSGGPRGGEVDVEQGFSRGRGRGRGRDGAGEYEMVHMEGGRER